MEVLYMLLKLLILNVVYMAIPRLQIIRLGYNVVCVLKSVNITLLRFRLSLYRVSQKGL
jgi:hypothetical protein